jgi:hypothetical protein
LNCFGCCALYISVDVDLVGVLTYFGCDETKTPLALLQILYLLWFIGQSIDVAGTAIVVVEINSVGRSLVDSFNVIVLAVDIILADVPVGEEVIQIAFGRDASRLAIIFVLILVAFVMVSVYFFGRRCMPCCWFCLFIVLGDKDDRVD